MKVVAFSAGRRNGNCEILIKTALMEIEKMGIDVELIRLHECDLRPCKGCTMGPCYMKGPAGCIIKDDAAWLLDKFLESDGYILGAPIWSLSPCGIVTDFRDRVFGPKMDVAGWELWGEPEWIKGRKLHRPGGLISVGGALSEHWTALGLPTLYTTTFSAQTDVVDNMNVYQVAGMGEALMRPDYIRRAQYLGQNVGHAVLNPQKDWENTYLGYDTEEACPGCHTSVVIAKPGRDYVECVVCGRRGYISVEDGRIAYKWPQDPANRLTVMGKFEHLRECAAHDEDIYQPHAKEIQENYDQYKKYEACVVSPPSKGKKKSSSTAEAAEFTPGFKAPNFNIPDTNNP